MLRNVTFFMIFVGVCAYVQFHAIKVNIRAYRQGHKMAEYSVNTTVHKILRAFCRFTSDACNLAMIFWKLLKHFTVLNGNKKPYRFCNKIQITHYEYLLAYLFILVILFCTVSI